MAQAHKTLAWRVFLLLWVVTTTVLLLFGVWDVLRTRAELRADLDRDLAARAEQLSAGLAPALWQLHQDSIDRVLESAMLDERIVSVILSDTDNGRMISARRRGGHGQSLPGVPDDGEQGALRSTTDVTYDGQTIGVLQIAMTDASLTKDLKQSIVVIAAQILALNVLLTLFTALLLQRLALKPLRAVERYAQQVGTEDEGKASLGRQRFSGELESLRASIEAMVRKLREAESEYRTIFENAMEGVFQSTPQGRFLKVNPAMARIFGFESPAEMMESVTDIAQQLYVRPEERDEFLEQVVRNQGAEGRVVLMKRKDGEAFWCSSSARMVMAADGTPLRMEGFLKDINKRVQAEKKLELLNRHLEKLVAERTEDLATKSQELEQTNQQLKDLDEMKTGLLSMVTHDLRTPLTSVLGYVKLVRREFEGKFSPLADGDEQMSRSARRILDNLEIVLLEGERLRRMASDLLDLTRIESGGIEWRNETVAIAELVDAAVNAVRERYDERPAVELKLEMDPGLPGFNLDRDRMVQVLVNLLDNAANFTDRGHVTVSGSLASSGDLLLRVQDSGAGIPARELERIFDKFHTVKHEGRPGGTGLGLAICRLVVEHHGGRIWAESSTGRGALFTIRIPGHRRVAEN